MQNTKIGVEGGHCRARLFQTKSGRWFHSRLFNIHSRPVPYCKIDSYGRYYSRTYYSSLRCADEKEANKEGFFVEKTIVDVKYLSDKDVHVPDFLKACQICSESIGGEKRKSAAIDVFVEKCTAKVLRSMTNDALIENPALSKFEYPAENKFPKTLTALKDLPAETGNLE